MRSFIFAAAIFLPASASSQSTPSQFDLECSGTTVSGTLKEISEKKDAAILQRSYRVDLDGRRYCTAECTETFPIHNVNSKFIILHEDRDDETFFEHVIFLNRESGELVDRWKLGSPFSGILGTAKCTKKRFSGFPVRKF